MKKLLWLAVPVIALQGCQSKPPAYAVWHGKKQPTAVAKPFPTYGRIERNDPALDALIPQNAKLEKLAEGITWAEGPVWVAEKRMVVFSDVPENTAWRWSENKGLAPQVRPSGYTGDIPRAGEPGSNGITRDSEGRLVLCQHGDRRVARINKDGSQTALADHYQGKRFNSPNDLVCVQTDSLFHRMKRRFTSPSRTRKDR
jgi:gluconolactonase